MRTVQVLINNSWITINHTELKMGDIFRMFEPDGSKVQSPSGNYIFVATCDTYIDKIIKQPTIQIDDLLMTDEGKKAIE